MVYFLSYSLFAIGIIEMGLGFSVLQTENRRFRTNILFIMFCLATAIWSLSFSQLCIHTEWSDVGRAVVRAILDLGIVVSTSSCVLMVATWVEIPRRMRNVLDVIMTILTVFAWPCVANPDGARFVTTQFGISYVHCYTWSRKIYTGYVIFAIVLLFVLVLSAFARGKRKRTRFVAFNGLIAAVMILGGSYFDIFSQMQGNAVFPASAYMMFLVVLDIYIFTVRMSANRISRANLSEYLFHLVATPILVLNDQRRVIYVNQSAVLFLGKKATWLTGMTMNQLFKLEGDYPTLLPEDINPLSSYTLEAIAKNNNARCQLRVSHINDVFGEVLGDVVVVTDMTDKLKMIEALQRSKESADKANLAKSNFLANMSHEMRTPMNVIIGMCEIAMKEDSSPEVEDALRNIHVAGKDLLDVINDVLDITKIEAGRFDIVPVNYNVDEMVSRIVTTMDMQFAQKGVDFYVNIDDSVPVECNGDDIRVRQIIMNLLSNAAKFTKMGYVRLNLSGHLVTEELFELEITVQDTGIGIKGEDYGKLFELFSQVDSKRNRAKQGTGLGLSICRGLARLMGGDITMNSVYGEGSTFRVTVRQKVVTPRTIGLAGAQTNVVDITKIPEARFLFCAMKEPFVKLLGEKWKKAGVNYDIYQGESLSFTLCEQYSHIFLTEEFFCAHPVLFEDENIRKKLVVVDACGYSTTTTRQVRECRHISVPMFFLQVNRLLQESVGEKENADSGAKAPQIREYPNCNVLVVDDSVTNLKVAKGMLRPYHFVLDTATSGAEAIEKVRGQHYDMIFMDHMMPEMDGIEAAEAIHAIAECEAIPIVALTANAIAGTREMFLEHGFLGFVAKPIDPLQLDTVIHEALGE